MNNALKLSAFEITSVRSWYKFAKDNAVLLGGFNPLLPLELALARKLNRHENETCTFSETEIELMYGWMNRAFYGRLRSEESLFGYELRASIKVRAGMRSLQERVA